MNIFSEPANFMGDILAQKLNKRFQTLLQEAAAICRSLGTNQELFYEYLSCVFEITAHAYDLANIDIDRDIHRSLCNIGHRIIRGDAKAAAQYPQIRAWISDYQEIVNEDVLLALMAGACVPQYLELSWNDYMARVCEDIKEQTAFQRIQALYSKIVALLGDEAPLENFNAEYYQIMSEANPAHMCQGELLCSMQEHLCCIEPSSGKYFIEILLSGINNSPQEGKTNG